MSSDSIEVFIIFKKDEDLKVLMDMSLFLYTISKTSNSSMMLTYKN